MTKQACKVDCNCTPGKPKPKPAPGLEADPHHDPVKRDEPLGRIGIAPAKPLWPGKK